MYSCYGNFTSQPGIFTGPFDNPPPSGIPGNVNHGGIGPVQTFCCGLEGSDPCRFLNSIDVPTAGLCQGSRDNGAMTGNDVVTETQWNFESRVFDCNALYTANIINGI